MAEIIAKLVLKRSATPEAVIPLDILDHGELAINFRDGKLFFRDHNNVIGIIGTRDPASLNESQTFTGVNTFTESIISEGENSFSGANEFSGVNTFTESIISEGDNLFSGANEFTKQITLKSVSLTHINLDDGVISWDAEDGNIATVTLTQNSSLPDIENAGPGSYVLRVIQDAIGDHELEFGSKFKSVDGEPITISTDADSISILTILNNGDDDLYVVGQSNFITFGNIVDPPPTFEGDVPNIIYVSGASNDGPYDINGTYYRVPDVEGKPAWVKIDFEDDTIQAIIRSESNYYGLFVEERDTASDPWNEPDAQYEVTNEFEGTSEPWLATWVNSDNDYTGDITVEEEFVQPDFLAEFTLSPSVSNGTIVEFYEYPSAVEWYGTDPIPNGEIYRSINPEYPASSSQRFLYLAPRNNNVNGEWQVGGFSSGVLIEIFYHASQEGPLGGYADAAVGGPFTTFTISAP
jgi:hypothetical protein